MTRFLPYFLAGLAVLLGLAIGVPLGMTLQGMTDELEMQQARVGTLGITLEAMRISREVGGVCHARVWRAVAVMDSTSQESE